MARGPSPRLVAPGQGRCFERGGPLGASTEPHRCGRRGRLLWVRVSCCSVRLPGEESASVIKHPRLSLEQCTADDSTATWAPAERAAGLGWVGVVFASLVLPSRSVPVCQSPARHPELQASFAWHTWVTLDQFPG